MTDSLNGKPPVWHALLINDLEELLGTDISSGLKQEEAKSRLETMGINRLPEGKPETIPTIFFRQFKSPLIYVLFISSIIIFSIGETIDSILILVVVLFNSIVGTIQEGKAQNTIQALKKFVKTNATVIRDGQEIIISDEEVVPGDILILQEGEKVPADARLFESDYLLINEAAMTGESMPVLKTNKNLKKEDLLITRQENMVFLGTNVARGQGKAIVVATGAKTRIGKIGEKIAAIDTEIPLRRDIRRLSKAIMIIVAASGLLVFSLGVFLDHLSAAEMFKTVISLAVSTIPEGLPIVLTLVLAKGVWSMAKKNVLVKKLQAVEALGKAHVIAVDKTGTITKNELVVRKIFVGGKMFELGGVGYETKGEIKINNQVVEPLDHNELLLAGRLASISASAGVAFNEEEKIWRVSGDPTEAAMLIAGEKIGFKKNTLEQENPKISELPFDYKSKYHATLNKTKDGFLLTTTGAPEAILSLSSKLFSETGTETVLTKKKAEELEKTFHQLSRNGLRVVAFGYREIKKKEPEIIKEIKGLVFGGFYAMEDSLREEAPLAVQRAQAAGLRVVMITGDHKLTATAIAKEAGIWQEGGEILTGDEINNLNQEELDEKVMNTLVFARVTPEDKMKIIQSYRRQGKIIAMTGDGVNDAPPLVAADLGIAMGKIGTEVAKEASDIILLDDNFGNIISAAEEGRGIYKTIKKVILYLLSTNTGEVGLIILALAIKLPLPILAAQIIWLNLVTDGFLDVALGMEKKDSGLLRRDFKQSRKIIDGLMIQRIIFMATPMILGTLYLFARSLNNGNGSKALTISLTTLAIFQWLNAWNCRSESQSLFKTNLFSNKFLVGATILVIFLQALAIYTPFMQKILNTTPLTLGEWLASIAVASSIIIIEEIRKFFYRKINRVGSSDDPVKDLSQTILAKG